jgi:UDP-N-acetylmuramate--alanine ligase
MSALARYFHHRGDRVVGYDRTPSDLTHELEAEGITISYVDAVEFLQSLGLAAEDTLVVRTPAVPEDSVLFTYFREHGFTIRKRAEVLGMVTAEKKALCVAGTHGKTTTSTMLAHLMNIYGKNLQKTTGDGVNAFLGGISMNYHTNLLLDKQSEYVVVEADEYDRSFHHLTPYMSVVTAVDADHLDIYGTAEAYREAFAHYTSLITGALVMKHGINLKPRLQKGVKCYTYGVRNDQMVNDQMVNGPDFYADNIRVSEGRILFDFHTPEDVVKDVELGVPVWVNIENAVAAMAVAWLNGVPEEELREGVASFKGVLRRFNIHVNTPEVVYIDDYAHHPEEIATAIDSIRKLFPHRRLIGVFQPHLYTRTRDFADDFARVLGTMDEVVLLPIYPARELPIAGVDSEMLLAKITNPNKRILPKPELVNYLSGRKNEGAVILTVGAGDIDRLVGDITKALG